MPRGLKWTESTRKRIHACKEMIDDYLESQPCARCGWDGPRAGKELHHRKPGTKIDTPRNLCTQNKVVAAKTELEKCMVVCGTCHNLIHAEIREGISNGRQ